MGVDYYNVLGVHQNATDDDDLRQAYKRLAMKWHPDKNLHNCEEAEAMFKLISEAYDVLSDPVKRWFYHQEILMNGAAQPSTSSSGSRPDSTYADDIFSDFFTGTDRSNSTDRDRNFRENERDSSSHASDWNQSNSSNKPPPVVTKLPLTLEKLYTGGRKKILLSRVVPDEFGNPMNIDEKLKYRVQPGWRKGAKLIFPGKGDFEAEFTPPDLVFMIDEKPHSVYTRDRHDLVTHQRVTCLESLTGKTIQLTTLDGRTLAIHVSGIIRPNHEMVIPNEGMPKYKDPTKKGNLRIRFAITFP